MGSTTSTSFNSSSSSSTSNHHHQQQQNRPLKSGEGSLSDLLSGYNTTSLVSLKSVTSSNGGASLVSIDSESSLYNQSSISTSGEDGKQVSYSSLHSFPPTKRRSAAANSQLLNNTTGNAKSCPLLPAVGTRVSTASSSKRPTAPLNQTIGDGASTSSSIRLPTLGSSTTLNSSSNNNLMMNNSTSSNYSTPSSSSSSISNNNINSIINNTVTSDEMYQNLLTKSSSKNSLHNMMMKNAMNNLSPSFSPNTLTNYGTTPQQHRPNTSKSHHHQQRNHLSTPSEDSLLNHPITPKVKPPPFNNLILNNLSNISSNPSSPNSPYNNNNNRSYNSTNNNNDDTSSNSTASTPSSLSNSPRTRVSLLQVAEQIHPLQDLITVPRLTQSRSLGILEEYLPPSPNTNTSGSMTSSLSSGQLQSLSTPTNNGSTSARRGKKSITPTLKDIQDMCCASENLSHQIDVEENLEKKRKMAAHKKRTELAEPSRVGTTAYKTREPRYGDSLSSQQANRRNQPRSRTKSPDYDNLKCETPSPTGLDAILLNSSRTLTNLGNDDVAIYITCPTSAPEIKTPAKSIAKEKKKRVLMLHQKHSDRKNHHAPTRRSHSVIGMVHH